MRRAFSSSLAACAATARANCRFSRSSRSARAAASGSVLFGTTVFGTMRMDARAARRPNCSVLLVSSSWAVPGATQQISASFARPWSVGCKSRVSVALRNEGFNLSPICRNTWFKAESDLLMPTPSWNRVSGALTHARCPFCECSPDFLLLGFSDPARSTTQSVASNLTPRTSVSTRSLNTAWLRDDFAFSRVAPLFRFRSPRFTTASNAFGEPMRTSCAPTTRTTGLSLTCTEDLASSRSVSFSSYTSK